jgi:hypothetical protein
MMFASVFFIAIGFILLVLAIWNWHPRYPAAVSEPVLSATVGLVIDMLKDGQGWEVDQYRATHPTGASIWIANSADYAELSLTGPVWPKTSPRANYVTTTKCERKALFAAAKALVDRRQVADLERATADWAGRVTQYADNVVSIRGAA